MGTSRAEGKRSLKEMEDDEEEDDEKHACGGGLGFGGVDDDRMKRTGKKGSGTTSSSCGVMPAVPCQVDDCAADLTNAKRYYKRHKVCEVHAKASCVLTSGIRQRFCQQCSRFHALSEFDENKRSCRQRLAGHNERRRKSSSDYYGEG